jgi:GntR family transcriptional regulator/MocR family aminotransferase
LLHIKIDPAAAAPLYEQLAQQIRSLISDGLLSPGSKLPGMRDLSHQLGVSLSTVHAACDLLAADHLIETRRGSGTFVCGPSVAAPNLRIAPGTMEEPAMDWAPYATTDTLFLRPVPERGKPVISFARASPDPALYPLDRIKQTVASMLWDPQEAFFDRGHPQGYQPLVELLEQEMARRGVPMAEGENEVIVTSGFQRALSITLQVLLQRGQQVAVEAPTYSSIVNQLRSASIEAVPVSMGPDGMDLGALETVLKKGNVRAIVTIPTFHNPTGATMSHAARVELLRLAVAYSVPIVEDEWAPELRYDGRAQPSLKALDPGGYVIQIGTFSKTFLPGLRLGWITCPSPLAITLLAAKHGADRGDSFFWQALMVEFIKRGHYARHLRHCVSAYRRRRNTMCRLLDKHLPPGCTYNKPDGGFSVWLKLPSGLSSLRLLEASLTEGVDFLTAVHCMADRSDLPACRLSFSRTDEAAIVDGIPRLCRAIVACCTAPELAAPIRTSKKEALL